MLNYAYFCAKLRKKVDTVKFIFGVLIVVLSVAAEIKKRYDKSKRAKAAVRNFVPIPVEKAATTGTEKKISARPKQPIVLTEKPAIESAKPPVAAHLFEEGTRVTTDTPMSAIPSHEATSAGKSAEEMRRLVLWGEILARKY